MTTGDSGRFPLGRRKVFDSGGFFRFALAQKLRPEDLGAHHRRTALVHWIGHVICDRFAAGSGRRSRWSRRCGRCRRCGRYRNGIDTRRSGRRSGRCGRRRWGGCSRWCGWCGCGGISIRFRLDELDPALLDANVGRRWSDRHSGQQRRTPRRRNRSARNAGTSCR